MSTENIENTENIESTNTVGWSLLGFWMFISQVLRTHFN